MGELAALLAAIAGFLGAVAALVKVLPSLRRLGLGDSRDCAREKADLKVEVDVWQEKYRLVAGERDAVTVERNTAQAELATCLLNLDFEKRAGRQARDDLDDVRSEVRAKLLREQREKR